ncbi:hypothetical protein A6D6_03878 [Alcanivorax xiamenensis]|uniref:Uncharacterized protein n=1 Tax=Alcanivorax xiamenensis TaxID=1177156 RepID=A0ABQ6Y342_9GAMM|nr:hypothetical protein [Alcanivorax xiamenensis]KAF0802887.1 hypothetical protein A6D6_03878 [Alcanivorax xiamenensis]
MLASALRNRPHRHVAASLLVGLEEPLRVQIAGHWVRSAMVWVAPDVEQALESPGPVAVLHLDPDDGAWRGLPVQGPGGALPESRLPGFREALAGLATRPEIGTVRGLRERLRAAAPPLARPAGPCAGKIWTAPVWRRRPGCPNPVSGICSGSRSVCL